MSDNLEFDFFAEETQPNVVPAPRVSGLGGLTGRQRGLAAAVAAGVVVLILVGVLATGGSSSLAAAEKGYLHQLSPIAADSQQTGRSLEHLFASLRTGGASSPLPALARLAARAQADLARARKLNPPAGLRPEQAQVVAALDFRARALEGVRKALGLALGSTHPVSGSAQVTTQIDRLVTSDVVWHDLVWRPAVISLQRVGERSPAVPQSQFLTGLNDSSPQEISLLLEPSVSGSALAVGATGQAVKAWQVALDRWLKKTGHKELTTDGSFGTGTQTATEALQRAEGLKPDGIVGPATRRALVRGLASK